MDSLFVRQAPKTGRICLMLGASLLLHGGLVGIAALWLQPQPEEHSIPFNWFEYTPPGETPSGPVSLPPIAPSETPEPTTTPDVLEKPEPTPPEPMGSPDFAEPTTPTPPRRTTNFKPITAVRTPNTQTNSHVPSGPSGGNAPGVPGTGPANTAGAWVMPHPPFPRQVLLTPVPGMTTVRITTDASGRVSSVVIIKSTGNPVLDNHTTNYVRQNWHGPPNAARTTEFVYQIK